MHELLARTPQGVNGWHELYVPGSNTIIYVPNK